MPKLWNVSAIVRVTEPSVSDPDKTATRDYPASFSVAATSFEDAIAQAKLKKKDMVKITSISEGAEFL